VHWTYLLPPFLVLVVFWFFVDDGNTVRGAVSPFSLIPAAVWLVPAVVLIDSFRRPRWRWVAAIAIAVADAFLLRGLFSNDSSMAGASVLFLPAILLGVAVGVRVLADWWREARQSPSPAGQP
jgi:hypothetical protein